MNYETPAETLTLPADIRAYTSQPATLAHNEVLMRRVQAAILRAIVLLVVVILFAYAAIAELDYKPLPAIGGAALILLAGALVSFPHFRLAHDSWKLHQHYMAYVLNGQQIDVSGFDLDEDGEVSAEELRAFGEYVAQLYDGRKPSQSEARKLGVIQSAWNAYHAVLEHVIVGVYGNQPVRFMLPPKPGRGGNLEKNVNPQVVLFTKHQVVQAALQAYARHAG